MPSASSTRVGSLNARLISATSWSATLDLFACHDLALVRRAALAGAVELRLHVAALVQPLGETSWLMRRPDARLLVLGRDHERRHDCVDPEIDARLVRTVHADEIVQVVQLLLVEPPLASER